MEFLEAQPIAICISEVKTSEGYYKAALRRQS